MCLMQINQFTQCKERIIYFIKDGGDMLKSRKVRKLLNQYNNFSLFIDIHYQENCKLFIEDNTYGLFPLLFAMVHPTVNVYLCSDSPLIHLYSKSKNLPGNINFGLNDNNIDNLECICIIDNVVNIKIIK